MNEKPVLLRRKEAAEYLNIKISTLEAWATRGGGPAYVKLGGAVRYRLSDLEAFVENNIVKKHIEKKTLSVAAKIERPDKNMEKPRRTKETGQLNLLIDLFKPLEPDVNPDKIKKYIPNLELAIETLDNREQCVLQKRYYENISLKSTGRLIVRVGEGNPCDGVSGTRARQIQAKAMRKLRHPTRMRIITGEISAKAFFMKPLDDDYCLHVKLKKGITDDVKKMSVYDFADWSTRTRNCFKNVKIKTVDDLLSKSEKDLLRIKNFGRKGLNEIRTVFNLK